MQNTDSSGSKYNKVCSLQSAFHIQSAFYLRSAVRSVRFLYPLLDFKYLLFSFTDICTTQLGAIRLRFILFNVDVSVISISFLDVLLHVITV